MLVRPPSAILRDLIRHQASSGILLVAVAAVALVFANSGLADLYEALIHLPIGLSVGAAGFSLPLLLWVNDGLMAVFFLLVGLEIKREILVGELSSPRRLALPGIAAIGGMIAPALIYAAINAHDPAAMRGWAIPTATDIAFALGVLSLLGKRVPLSLTVFLTALAILDDLGAILIIAIAYSHGLSVPALALSAAGIASLALLNWAGIRHLGVYLAIGLLVWVAVFNSGIHATLAGVAVALTIPLRAEPGIRAPLLKLEHLLKGPVSFAILPIFGFVNAGVSFTGLTTAAFAQPITLGVAAGLFLGKQFGVGLAMFGSVRSGIAALPAGASLVQTYGVAVLCGIGFTMSLFIGSLAFADDAQIVATKLGVLGGSLLSALLGYAILAAARKRPR